MTASAALDGSLVRYEAPAAERSVSSVPQIDPAAEGSCDRRIGNVGYTVTSSRRGWKSPVMRNSNSFELETVVLGRSNGSSVSGRTERVRPSCGQSAAVRRITCLPIESAGTLKGAFPAFSRGTWPGTTGSARRQSVWVWELGVGASPRGETDAGPHPTSAAALASASQQTTGRLSTTTCSLVRSWCRRSSTGRPPGNGGR